MCYVSNIYNISTDILNLVKVKYISEGIIKIMFDSTEIVVNMPIQMTYDNFIKLVLNADIFDHLISNINKPEIASDIRLKIISSGSYVVYTKTDKIIVNKYQNMLYKNIPKLDTPFLN